jgi:hypothetical protein
LPPFDAAAGVLSNATGTGVEHADVNGSLHLGGDAEMVMPGDTVT